MNASTQQYEIHPNRLKCKIWGLQMWMLAMKQQHLAKNAHKNEYYVHVNASVMVEQYNIIHKVQQPWGQCNLMHYEYF